MSCEAAIPPQVTPAREWKREAYSIAPLPSRDTCRVLHRTTGRLIALAPTLEQAETLCDTLNLACGALPSRRFLDAVHQRGDSL